MSVKYLRERIRLKWLPPREKPRTKEKENNKSRKVLTDISKWLNTFIISIVTNFAIKIENALFKVWMLWNPFRDINFLFNIFFLYDLYTRRKIDKTSSQTISEFKFELYNFFFKVCAFASFLRFCTLLSSFAFFYMVLHAFVRFCVLSFCFNVKFIWA